MFPKLLPFAFFWFCQFFQLVVVCAQDSAVSVLDSKKLVRATEFSDAMKELVRVSRPTVVSISSTKHIARRKAPDQRQKQLPDSFPHDLFDNEFFERFFDFEYPKGGHYQRGLGSGVIVRKEGYILTNNHVVGDADEVNVTLADKRSLPAKVVGIDRLTDLAVLKIEADPLPYSQLGDSTKTEVGEWVLAIGSPFGLDQTVTCGIISAKGRAQIGITAYEDFLQTDAAINPGNSGGPLVNLKGEIIGINTAIASGTGGYAGVGFSIPSHQARGVLESILKEGRVIRGWLGAVIQDLTPELAKSFGYDHHEGVLIDDVIPKSPAEVAGLRPGDIVTLLNRNSILNANQFRNAIAAIRPNTKADIDVMRKGKSIRLTVTVGSQEHEERIESHKSQSHDANALGLSVENLTTDLAKELGINETTGVIVSEIDSSGLANLAGIRRGDLILEIGSHPVKSLQDFQKATREIDIERGVRLQIKSDGVRRFVFLQGRRS